MPFRLHCWVEDSLSGGFLRARDVVVNLARAGWKPEPLGTGASCSGGAQSSLDHGLGAAGNDQLLGDGAEEGEVEGLAFD